MAWEIGAYWLNTGATQDFWFSWDETWQGLQYAQTRPAPSGARVDVVAYGIQNRGTTSTHWDGLITYWLTVVNRANHGTNFYIRGAGLG
ncbi:hypothetical protein JNUCC64_01495 [Streptomyces sp. JNUCC 64]